MMTAGDVAFLRFVFGRRCCQSQAVESLVSPSLSGHSPFHSRNRIAAEA